MVAVPDWTDLRARAVRAAESAYAPYSGLCVGAAGLAEDGRVVLGCNVENASYGLGLCAECTLIGALRLADGGGLVALSCLAATGAPLLPCGRCRQLLYEMGGPSCLVDTPRGAVSIADLLPEAFGSGDLPA